MSLNEKQEEIAEGKDVALEKETDDVTKENATDDVTKEKETKIVTDRPVVFFDIDVAGEGYLGRIVMELFSDVVPKTVDNFRFLCTGEKGVGPRYKEIFRIVKMCWCTYVIKGVSSFF